MEKLLDKLIAISAKFAQNSVLNIIQGAFMMLMPITMIGGFTALFNGIGIDAYQAFITSTGIKGVLSVIYQWTIGMFGVYVSFLVAYQFAKVHRCAKSDISVGLVALVCFLIVTPFVTPEEPYAPMMLPTSWLGASGMFTGIIIAFVVGYIFKFCQKYNIVIKLPEQVPPMVSAQFTSIIPGTIAMVLFGIVNAVFAGTSLGSFHQLIYTVVSAPLNAVGSNVFGCWILMVVLYGLWFCGIHGGMTVGPIIMMLFMQLQMENMAAYQAGQPLPHMFIGDSLSYSTGSLPMIIAALLVCKSESNKSIARLGFLPAFFGVDEPVYFGFPMILNPMFFIPWVLIAPTVAVFGTHLLKLIGLLGYSNGTGGQNAANLPFFVGNMMNYGVRGLIWGCVLFAVIVLAYVPFVKAYDKQMLEKEKETAAE
ncbi:MAG: PTS sugar transporter subunit IIC [Solobacterium sp.]|nr:PTS sugar transporter subunit IIC [Solobacterium sp.]MBQ9824284.1 PTS sugar transporter subunit IIC [Solobacterium sp.]